MILATTPTAPTVAVTGATGFVGRGIVAALRRRGIRVRALARSADTALEADAEVIRGTLEDPPSLARLTEGCPVLVHCAGAVRASTADAFHRINADATAALGRLCAENGVRLVLVSSLAAREPGLSPYAASKRAAEEALASTPGLDWCAVRPPLVYGPGDRATLPVFKMMRHGWLAVPAVPAARFSAIYRDDLGEAVAALAENDVRGIFDVSDATPDGYTWNDMAAAAASHLQRRVRMVAVPPWVMQTVGAANAVAAKLTGGAPMVYPGKVRELYHIDWACGAGPLTSATGWRPRIALGQGVAQTFRWYADNNWL